MSWKYILPFGNLALAAGLMRLASHEAEQYLSRNNAIAVWDYIPPAAQIAYIVNFPAFVASTAMSSLMRPRPLTQEIVFLVCVAALWHLLGRRAEHTVARGKRGWHGRTSAATSAIGGAASLGAGLFAIAQLTSHLLLGLAGLAWCGFLVWQFLGALRKALRGEADHAAS
jgi:hypothetical protein